MYMMTTPLSFLIGAYTNWLQDGKQPESGKPATNIEAKKDWAWKSDYLDHTHLCTCEYKWFATGWLNIVFKYTKNHDIFVLSRQNDT